MTAYAMLMAMPLFVAIFALGEGRSKASLAAAESSGPARSSSSIKPVSLPMAPAISLEPAALTPVVDVESTVVFPGYLLPDDDREDPTHAGS
jgi:hypothetical protein